MTYLLEHIEINTINRYLDQDIIHEDNLGAMVSKLTQSANHIKQSTLKTTIAKMKSKVSKSEKDATEHSSDTAKGLAAIVALLAAMEGYIINQKIYRGQDPINDTGLWHAIKEWFNVPEISKFFHDTFHSNTPFEAFKERFESVFYSDSGAAIATAAMVVGLIWALYQLILGAKHISKSSK